MSRRHLLELYLPSPAKPRSLNASQARKQASSRATLVPPSLLLAGCGTRRSLLSLPSSQLTLSLPLSQLSRPLVCLHRSHLTILRVDRAGSSHLSRQVPAPPSTCAHWLRVPRIPPERSNLLSLNYGHRHRVTAHIDPAMMARKSDEPRLRASCDACFSAKVKCSKTKPVCSRCLTCGSPCNYSPCLRSGRAKSAQSSSTATPPGLQGISAMPAQQPMPVALTDLSPMAHDVGMTAAGYLDPTVSAAMYPPGTTLTASSDMSAQFVDPSVITTPLSHGRSNSYDSIASLASTGIPSAPSVQSWTDQLTPDVYAYGPTQMSPPGNLPSPVSVPPQPGSMPIDYFPDPAATFQLGSPVPSHLALPSTGGYCTCFTACLQSLQALHNASTPEAPSLDLILSLNRKAVEGCASMLSCARCLGRSGTHTAAMLLATVMGKVTSFYKIAFYTYFDGGGVSRNGTTGTRLLREGGSRWVELEILTGELKKLQEVYGLFREVCGELSESDYVSRAIASFLHHDVGSMLEVIEGISSGPSGGFGPTPLMHSPVVAPPATNGSALFTLPSPLECFEGSNASLGVEDADTSVNHL
ncbi:hypothetical protein VTK56DRAFT_3754 [Thermocarpiscus australiensis]